MKRNPADELLRLDMEAGRLAGEGFLGTDERPVSEIIAADRALLASQDLGARELAQALRDLTRKGMEGQGQPVETGDFAVTVEEYMGRIGCPFKDGFRAAKRNTRAVSRATGESLSWSDLALHLIEAHGFFQGKGSPWRLEPLAAAAFLKPAKEARE